MGEHVASFADPTFKTAADEISEDTQDLIESDKEIQTTVTSKPQESEHDTDLEDEIIEEQYDPTGRSHYLDYCRKLGVVPAGYFVRHMNDAFLEMRHHGLGYLEIKAICNSLVINGTITKLDLSDNWLGYEGTKSVMDMLKENCFIVDINLSNNRITNKSAEKMCEILANNLQLQRVDLSFNEFDDKTAYCFSDLIGMTPRMEYLNLSHNNFGEAGGMILGKALGDSVTLVECDLSWNHIRGKGVKGICVGIGHNTVMQKFHLGWNGFGPVFGALELGKALKNNNTLEELDITNNRITTEGAVLIGKGLSVNTSLKILKIGKNPMQTAGCYAIINAIVKNPESAMESVDFQDILVNDDFKELHQLAREQFPSLKVHTGTKIPKRPMSVIHPLIRLRNYARKNKINLCELFKQLDDDEDMKLSCEEFINGINQLRQFSDFVLNEDEVSRLINDLDKDEDGHVNYSELVVGFFQDAEVLEEDEEEKKDDEAENLNGSDKVNLEGNEDDDIMNLGLRTDDDTFITNK